MANSNKIKSHTLKYNLIIRIVFLCVIITALAFPGCSRDKKQNYVTGNDDECGQKPAAYWPTNGWKTCKPEKLNMDSKKLNKAILHAISDTYDTEGTIIVRKGYIVAEAYVGNFTRDTRHKSFSVAKSFTSALIGIALQKGMIKSIDDPIYPHFPELKNLANVDLKKKITIRHIVTLTTGLEWDEDWEGLFWFINNDAVLMHLSGKSFEYVLSKKSAHEPGTVFKYSTGDPSLISGIIENVTNGSSAYQFALENLFKPIGIPGVRWKSDKKGRTTTFAGLQATVREYAKFGYLYLNNGKWENRQIVPEKWVTESTTSRGMTEWYGYLWHVNLPVKLKAPGSKIPADGYMAHGIYGQCIIVIPSKDLVIIRVGDDDIDLRGFDKKGYVLRVLDSII